MPNFNQITLAGHLSKDPVLSYLPSQTAVCNSAIAVNQKYTDSAGNKQEKVCFVDLAIYGKRAEAFASYLSKGSPVLLTGALAYHQWTSKDGSKHSKHEVVIREFFFIDSAKKGDANAH